MSDEAQVKARYYFSLAKAGLDHCPLVEATASSQVPHSSQEQPLCNKCMRQRKQHCLPSYHKYRSCLTNASTLETTHCDIPIVIMRMVGILTPIVTSASSQIILHLHHSASLHWTASCSMLWSTLLILPMSSSSSRYHLSCVTLSWCLLSSSPHS